MEQHPVGDERTYLRRTLSVTGYVTLFVVMLLTNFGVYWAIAPLVAGVGLAVVLLLVWDGFIRTVTKPSTFKTEKKLQITRAQRLFVVLALVKYPMVGALIWFLTRVWDTRSLVVFTAGIVLLHAVIALRAVGKLLTEQT